MTNRSRLPGARETAAICWVLAVEDRGAGDREEVGVPADLVVPVGGPDVVVEADDEQVEVAGCARDGGDLLGAAVEDRGAGDREPVRVPADLVVPVGGPDVVVEADDEQVEVAGCARDGGDLLGAAVEDRGAGDREPVPAPADLVVPVGGPDVVVEADDEQVEVAGCARDGGDLLGAAVEDRCSRSGEPLVVPHAHGKRPPDCWRDTAGRSYGAGARIAPDRRGARRPDLPEERPSGRRVRHAPGISWCARAPDVVLGSADFDADNNARGTQWLSCCSPRRSIEVRITQDRWSPARTAGRRRARAWSWTPAVVADPLL